MASDITLHHDSGGVSVGEPRIALLLNGDGLAVNAIMLSPDRAYEPPQGMTLLRDFPPHCGIGWRHAGGEWHAPAPLVAADTSEPGTP
jgi:hypothetical protein